MLPDDPRKELLSVPEMARWLKVSNVSVYAMVSRGELPHFHIGRRVRFNRGQIEDWLEEKQKKG